MPMRPSPSPTTVSAAKPSTRPPFTTLVTRLIATIFSRNPSVRSSPGCILDACSFAICWSLELQPGRPRGLGERLDAPVELVARAIESDLLDAELLCFFGDALAYLRRRLDVAAVLHSLPHLGLHRRGRRQH